MDWIGVAEIRRCLYFHLRFRVKPSQGISATHWARMSLAFLNLILGWLEGGMTATNIPQDPVVQKAIFGPRWFGSARCVTSWLTSEDGIVRSRSQSLTGRRPAQDERSEGIMSTPTKNVNFKVTPEDFEALKKTSRLQLVLCD